VKLLLRSRKGIILGTDQILAELIKAGSEILCSEKHKLICSTWNKEELPQQWKELKAASQGLQVSAHDTTSTTTEKLEAAQQSPSLLKQKDRAVITSVGNLESKKRNIVYCLRAVTGGEWGQCSKKTWVTYFRYVVFSNLMLLLQRLLRMYGNLVQTLLSKIILSLWE
jgi:hypothetical protein